MVPAGQRVVIDIKSIHFDPEIYPEPDRCDLFRFSRLRDTDGNDSKYGFATVDKHVSPSFTFFRKFFLMSTWSALCSTCHSVLVSSFFLETLAANSVSGCIKQGVTRVLDVSLRR